MWQLKHEGLKNIEDQGKAIEKIGQNTADVWTNAFDGWANGFSATLTDMVWGAETSFKQIATSFGKMITQVMIQQAMVKTVSGISSMFMHDGGVVGSGKQSFSRSVPAGTFAAAPRFHTGLMPDEFPAILQKGEGVFTSKQMAALGGMNQAINIKFNITNNIETEATARQDGPARWDGAGFVINVILDAVERNKGGFRNNMKAALMG